MLKEVVTIVCDIHELAGEDVEAETRTLKIDGRKTKRDLCDSCHQLHEPLLRVLARK